ncbi:MAG: DUF3836 domain-containing protein [Bacteroides sp.]|nr:DUF3836 domain-containing protein [Bacteroides sp.]
MKTQNLFKAMLLLAMVFIANTTVMVANDNDPDKNNFIRNVEEVDGLIMSETIFKMESGMLTNYMKHTYKYDADKQRIEDEIQKWNAVSNSWDNDMRLQYSYNDNSITTEYYKWNKKKKTYVIVPEMTITMDK